ncbi:helix-turn-helix domain-containing protein [Marinicauda sp. Alg238-R41]|uniref:helix-turn-helix domain-containing protein n=2 Tax=Alphaproteobacteria TaxID=28211 RepID=UPI0022E4A8E9|nr:XRE family transcriptional regulator [Marinicauda sp. Alg238-R41]
MPEQYNDPKSLITSARGGSPSRRAPVELGERVRAIRRARKWTLEEAARRTGLAASTLSKIENDHMSPTFDVVQRLASGFDVDITELFAASSGERPSGRRSITRANEGREMETHVYAHKLLAAELVQKRILPFVTTVKARSIEDFDEWKGHEGEEFVYVLDGEVLFFTEHYEPDRLGPGDCIYIDSGMKHACISVSEQDARVLWINTG